MANLTAAQVSVYEAVRRLMLDLQSEVGVDGVVVLDRDGGIVLHIGEVLLADPRNFLAEVYRVAGVVETLRDGVESPETAHLHLQDGYRIAWSADTGFGTRLIVLWDHESVPGLFWRSCLPRAKELRRLLELLLPEDQPIDPDSRGGVHG